MTRFWTTAELRVRGRSEREIRRAAERAVISCVRKGHFVSGDADPQVLRAVRVGGVATATTAARALGIWTPPDPPPDTVLVGTGRTADRLHVAVPRNAARLRDPDDVRLLLTHRPEVVLQWVDPEALHGTDRSRIAPPLLLLQHAFLSLPPERALAMLDSAIRLRHLRQADVPALLARLPERLHPVVRATDRADSGTETITRYFLRRLGLRVEVLVPIDGLGDVDLLVEGRLIVELDGREFHDPAEAFANDRRRDLVAAVHRYRSLRFTWSQVLFGWEQVEAAVLAALAMEGVG